MSASAGRVWFKVPIVPIGKARARVTRHGTYTPAATKRAEAQIAAAAILAMRGIKPATGPVRATIEATFPIPASWPQKRRHGAIRGEVMPVGRPDADNVSKLVLDACNGIVYADDGQIVDLNVTKAYGTFPQIVAWFDWRTA